MELLDSINDTRKCVYKCKKCNCSLSVLKPHRVSWGEDGVVIRWFQRPRLSFNVGKKRRRLPLARNAHLLVDFSHSSGIRAQFADRIGEPFLEGTDRVPRSTRWGVWAGAGAPWALVRHTARWWGVTAFTACHRVRLCCWERQKEGEGSG